MSNDIVIELRECAELLREGQAQSYRRHDPERIVLSPEHTNKIVAALIAAADLIEQAG